MTRTIAESERNYEEVKKFFRHLAGQEFIVRMSDAPMEAWDLIPFLEENYVVHGAFESGVGYAAFYYFEGCYEFKYLDENLEKVEILKTGEVIVFQDLKVNEFNMKHVELELRAFVKELQGS